MFEFAMQKLILVTVNSFHVFHNLNLLGKLRYGCYYKTVYSVIFIEQH